MVFSLAVGKWKLIRYMILGTSSPILTSVGTFQAILLMVQVPTGQIGGGGWMQTCLGSKFTCHDHLEFWNQVTIYLRSWVSVKELWDNFKSSFYCCQFLCMHVFPVPFGNGSSPKGRGLFQICATNRVEDGGWGIHTATALDCQQKKIP